MQKWVPVLQLTKGKIKLWWLHTFLSLEGEKHWVQKSRFLFEFLVGILFVGFFVFFGGGEMFGDGLFCFGLPTRECFHRNQSSWDAIKIAKLGL